MASLYGKNFTAAGAGAPGSAGTNDTKVDRPNESLSGQATTDTTLGNTRGNFDTYKAIGTLSRQNHIIDTSGTAYNDPWQEIKNARPSVW